MWNILFNIFFKFNSLIQFINIYCTHFFYTESSLVAYNVIGNLIDFIIECSKKYDSTKPLLFAYICILQYI